MQRTQRRQRTRITPLAVLVAFAGLLTLAAGPRVAEADPYAGYARDADRSRSVDREARTVSRGAVVVERDRQRVAERARAQRLAAAREVHGIAVPNVPERSSQGQPGQQVEQPDQAQQRQAEGRQPHHTNPTYANNPHFGLQAHLDHRPRLHPHPRRHVTTHHHYRVAPRRAHVHHLRHPSIYHKKHVIVSDRKHRVHRPHRSPRIRTSVHLGYYGKHVGVHYRHGLSTHKFRHHRHHRKHCSATGIRLHLRF